MGFQYVSYDLLEKYLKESISTEIKHHKIDEPDLKKALNMLYQTHPERAIQCKFLLTIMDCLKSQSDVEKKTCILNAATFYVRNQILESYQGLISSFLLMPESSNLFNVLTISLRLHKENFPDPKKLLDMYDALSNFMHAYVYQDSDPSKGYLSKNNQMFSKQKIKGYDVEGVLNDLLKKITALKLEQVALAKQNELAKALAKRSGITHVGVFSERTHTTTVTYGVDLKEASSCIL